MFAVVVFAFFVSSFAADKTITKKEFIDGMIAGLPPHLCGTEKSFFRSCFTVTEEECSKTMTATTTECLNAIESKLPAIFQQPNDGKSWGEKTGFCAGGRFESVLEKKKIVSADCNDIKKWKKTP